MTNAARNSLKIALIVAVASVAAIIACGVGNQKAPATQPKAIAYGDARKLGSLAAGWDVPESSGLTAGRVNKGVFWTHNDSGDTPVLYAFDRKGKYLAKVSIAGAAAADWEDLCSWKVGEKGYLLIGDFGDNMTTRDRGTLYLLEEPKLDPAAKGLQKLSASIIQKVHFTFEGGPANCESVGYDPTTRTVVLVTKADAPAGVYLLPWPKKPGDETVKIERVATLDIPTTSAMDISPDGLRAADGTYDDAYEYVRKPTESWADAFKREPRTLKMPYRAKGEGLCYGPEGRSLYLTSEGSLSPLWEVPATSPTTRPKGP